MDNEDKQLTEQQIKSKLNHKGRASNHLIEARTLDLVSMLESGTPKDNIRTIFCKKYDYSPKNFYIYYDKALDLIKKQMSGNIDRLRGEYILNLKQDLKQAWTKFEQYDRQPDIRANALAHKWFQTYLDVKMEMATYYPGLKPDAPEKDNLPSIQFMADDGIDEVEDGDNEET